MKPSDKADRAEAAAARRIAAAFRQSVEKARARADRKALVDALARGDPYAARNIVATASAAEGFRAVEAAWGHAAAEAGRLAADEAPDLPVRKRLSFNPFGNAAGILGRWGAQLGSSLANLATRAIDAVLGTGLAQRQPPEQLADDLIAAMGLSPRDAQAVLNYRRSLENRDRAALRSQLRDARNDPRILNAIREDAPLPPEYVDKLVAGYAARLEASRAAMIGRTEALRARWIGVQAMWQEQVDAGLVPSAAVIKRWRHRHDNRVRDTHLSIPDIQPDGVPLDQAFRTSAGNMLAFPGDPSAPMSETANCRCFLSYVVRNEAQAA